MEPTSGPFEIVKRNLLILKLQMKSLYVNWDEMELIYNSWFNSQDYLTQQHVIPRWTKIKANIKW
jgi:hypothetical protein